MRYLIDGYNLAHATGDLEGKVNPLGVERARKALIARLAAAYGNDVGQVAIVFDAEHAPRDTPAAEVVRGIDVRYALDEEADDLIERLIRAHSSPKQLTVVSSDRRIKDAARRRGCTAMGSSEYLDWLDRPKAPPAAPGEEPAKPEVTADDAAFWNQTFRDDRRS